MDALTERVAEARIQLLRSRLKLAIEQRNGFAEKFFFTNKTPYQERREIIEDCDRDIESIGKPEDISLDL
jgi:hypothetical protein